MIQCTKAEYRDAKIAQLWIDSIPSRLRLSPLYRDHIHRLIARYGLLFQPRRLLCPRCVGGVGVHYGNHPETVRQGWRRRNNKPDTTVATNLPSVNVPLNHWLRYQLELVKMRQEHSRGRKRRTKTDSPPRTPRTSSKA
jgi:hypothetical protein